METMLNNLVPNWKTVLEPFQPSAKYYRALDYLMYLKEDCSYRADRVDAWLTLLWHPYEDRLVGLRLKGLGCILQDVKKVLDEDSAEDFVPFAILLFEVLLTREGDKILDSKEQDRKDTLKDKYRIARKFAESEKVVVPRRELEALAA